MDTTIRPGTIEEKFELMKGQLERKGKWNAESERALRDTLNFPAEVPVAEPKKVAKKPKAKKAK